MIALIQARMGSTRLPGKVLAQVFEGRNMLHLICDKLNDSNVDDFIILTSINNNDDVIADFAIKNGFKYFRGAESDVLGRFCSAINEYKLPSFIRVCADNPILSRSYLNDLVTDFKDLDYLSHSFNGVPGIKTHFGLFAEAVNSKALLKLDEELPMDSRLREHVTAGLYENKLKYNCEFIEVDYLHPNLRFTVDDLEDLEIIKNIENISNIDFGDPKLSLNSLINAELKDRMFRQIRKYEK